MEKILKEAGYPYRYKATGYEKGRHLLCGDLSTGPEYLKSIRPVRTACGKLLIFWRDGIRHDRDFKALK